MTTTALERQTTGSSYLDEAIAAENLVIKFGELAAGYQADGNLSEAERLRNDAVWWSRKARDWRARHLELVEQLARVA